MEQTNNLLQQLMKSIEGLCHENEILRLLLQENWPQSQRLSPQAILGQACRASEEEFRSRSRNADTKLASVVSVPAPCQEILASLTEWIQEIRTQTFGRIQKLK
jgi:hypothetical protein